MDLRRSLGVTAALVAVPVLTLSSASVALAAGSGATPAPTTSKAPTKAKPVATTKPLVLQGGDSGLPTSLDTQGAARGYTTTLNHSDDTDLACTPTYTVRIRSNGTLAPTDVQVTLNGSALKGVAAGDLGANYTGQGKQVPAGNQSPNSSTDSWTLRYVGPPVYYDAQVARSFQVVTTAVCGTESVTSPASSIAIRRPSVKVALPASITRGKTTTFSVTVANTTSSTYTGTYVLTGGCDSPSTAADSKCTGKVKAGDISLSIYNGKSFSNLSCTTDGGLTSCKQTGPYTFKAGTTSTQSFRVTIRSGTSFKRLSLLAAMTRPADGANALIAVGTDGANIVNPVQGRPVPTLPQTGAPAMPQTVGAGLALLLLGMLLAVAGRRATRGRHAA